MAISSLINPTGAPSIQDDLWHIAHSTASGQIDMKYVFDIFVNNVQLIRAKVFPNPTNGRGYFNASRVIQNEVTYNWFIPETTGEVLVTQPPFNAMMQTYSIRVGEEVSGITTTNMASGLISAYNYIPKLYKRRQVGIYPDKVTDWLSDRPLTIIAQYGQKIFIPLYFVDNNNGVQADVRKKVNGVWTGFNEATAFYGSQSQTLAVDFMQLDIGTDAINNTFGYTFLPTNCSEYIIRMYSINDDDYSEEINVKLICDSLYSAIPLHFINSYGMFETALFRLVNKLQMDIERKSYQKDAVRFTNNAVTYYTAGNVYHETKINFANNIKWKYKLTMDYPTDAEFVWLEQLIYSPQIYAEIDGNYYPVTITNTNYEYYQQKYAGLKTLEVEIEMNQKRFAFRR